MSCVRNSCRMWSEQIHWCISCFSRKFLEKILPFYKVSFFTRKKLICFIKLIVKCEWKKMLNEGKQMHNFMSSSGTGTVINYGSGSDFFTSYGSGSAKSKSYGSGSGFGSTTLEKRINKPRIPSWFLSVMSTLLAGFGSTGPRGVRVQMVPYLHFQILFGIPSIIKEFIFMMAVRVMTIMTGVWLFRKRRIRIRTRRENRTGS